VGTLCIVDHDTVALNNLNRQILHSEKDIGTPKTDSARRNLQRLNAATTLETVADALTAANTTRLTAGFDVIVDALDNLPTRMLLNQAAITNNIALVHGAVEGFEGRVMTVVPGQSACLQCVYTGSIPEKTIPVIGVTPGVIGAIQATEVIKHITGVGDLLTGRMVRYDGLTLKFNEFTIKRNPACEVCRHL
jgi:adenylyltransferase/sulfurtransferase